MYYSENKSIDDLKFWTVRLPRYQNGTRTYRYRGQYQVHRFNADDFGDQTPPSWFITRCSRAMAETVLRAAERLGYGNTLMRESTTHMSNGSYVISKLVREQTDVQFDHYEVIRVAGGYKIKVENEHEPMTCLTEVMHYFQRKCGLDTELLTTNDRRQLQVEAQGEPSFVDRFTPQEPEPDYDDPGPGSPSWGKDNSSRRPPVEGGGSGGRCVPPPMPHMQRPLSAPGYANQEMEREVKEAQTLPVAPPPPRDPIAKGGPQASAAPHTPGSLRPSSLMSTKLFSGPASPRDDKPSQLEQSLANVTLRKTGNKPTLSASPQQQQQQQQAYRLNVSKSVHSAIKSPDSPNKFPVGGNSQTKVSSTNVPLNQKVTNVCAPSVPTVSCITDNGASGVDGRASGGVGTLLKRFEVLGNPQSPGGEKPVVKKEKKVQFQHQEKSSVDIPMTGSVGRLGERRKSEPPLFAQNIKQKFEGLNPEFKSRLENMIGGAHTVAAPHTSRPSIKSLTASSGTASPVRPLPPTPHDVPHDHIYEALPDHDIPPDEVTYYNDSGHGSM
ncbi:uncharacterized protein LOC128229196 [Mya arenaria]|uniref:uncharacterized protein LOC128229196 n=1 Tax=Mya arenaria TaxID=6604 RepID=UPI0022E55C9A|nr:uncharacterized protein LOC128229196 [Mya arenaria]